MISLLVAGATFSIGVCLLSYSTGQVRRVICNLMRSAKFRLPQATPTSAITTALVVAHAGALLALLYWFLTQQQKFSKLAFDRDTIKEVISATLDKVQKHLKRLRDLHNVGVTTSAIAHNREGELCVISV